MVREPDVEILLCAVLRSKELPWKFTIGNDP